MITLTKDQICKKKFFEYDNNICIKACAMGWMIRLFSTEKYGLVSSLFQKLAVENHLKIFTWPERFTWSNSSVIFINENNPEDKIAEILNQVFKTIPPDRDIN